MPMNCADFLKKAKTKRLTFALVRKEGAWKFFIDAEMGTLLNADSPKDETPPITGKAEWKNNKYMLLVDGDKEEAKKALKAAYALEKIKWDDGGIEVKGSNEGQDASHGSASGPQSTAPTSGTANPATLPQPTDVSRAHMLSPLEGHKINVLNPKGPENGILKVPMLLTDAQIAAVLTKCPPGTKVQKVNAGAITLDTPVPNSVGSRTGPPPGNVVQAPPKPTQGAPAKAPYPTAQDVAADKAFAAAWEMQQFKNRLQYLMPEISLVRSSDPALAKKVADATVLAKTAPHEANRALHELANELGRNAHKDDWSRVASQFRLDWEVASGGTLVKDPVLLEKRKEFEALLAAKKDYKAAFKAVLDLQAAINKRQMVRNRIVHKWSAITTPERNITAIAAELKMPEDQIALVVKEMQADLEGLRPHGFKFDSVDQSRLLYTPNPDVTAVARPRLSPAEARAVYLYTKDNGPNPKNPSETGKEWAPFRMMNGALWTGKEPPPPSDEVFKNLQAAFAKTKPFPKAVPVERGLNFTTQEDLDKFLKPYRDNAGKKIGIPLPGFISSCSGGVPVLFTGNVKLCILAKQGLDIAPYSESPTEAEILFNHNTMFKVLRVKKKGDTWEVSLEQCLPNIKK